MNSLKNCFTKILLPLALLGVWLGGALAASAASGTWISTAGGSWAAGGNWSGGTIADGAGNTASFNTLSLAADATVSLDGARIIGNLSFDDLNSTKHNWFLTTGSGGPLTLSGTVTVGSGVTSTIGVTLAGGGNLTKAGVGTLSLTNVNNVLNGITIMEAGALELAGVSTTMANSVNLGTNSLLTIKDSASLIVTNILQLGNPGSAPGMLKQSGGTLSFLGTGNTFRIAHWPIGNCTNLISGGIMTATGAVVYVGWDGNGFWNISGGTSTVYGVSLGRGTTGIGRLDLTGGRLELGAGGLAYVGGRDSEYLGGGTLVANAPWSSGAYLQFTNTGGYTTIDTRTNAVTLSGNLFGIGGFTNVGSGVLTLSGGNTYSGPVVVKAGLLKIGNSAALGATTTGTIITNTGMIDLNGINLNAEPLTISGGGTNGTIGAIINAGAALSNQGVNGPVTLAGDTVLNAASRWDIRSTLTGNGFKLTKIGGSEIFIPAAGDMGLGDIELAAGQITLGGNTRLGLAAKTISIGGTLSCYASDSTLASPVSKIFVVSNNATIKCDNLNLILSGPVTLQGLVNLGGDGTSIGFLGPIAGASGSIAKGGNHSLLLNGTNTYAGNTTISGGRLALGANGSISNSPIITVASGKILDVASVTGGFGLNSNQTLICNGGVVTGSVATASNSVIIPGTDGTAGTATITNGSLTLNGGSKLRFDLSSSTASGNDLVDLNGNLSLNGTIPVNFNFIGGPPVLGTPYTIIRYSGTRPAGGAANFTATGTHYTATFSDATANEIRVTFSGSASLVWRGNYSPTNWDVGTSSNWINGAVLDLFLNGDNVAFDNTATNYVANLVGTLAPGSVTVNSTNSFTWAGSGSLGGTGTLTKTNTGTLTINNANTAFTGPIVVSGGTLKLGVNTALGATSAGTTIINGGTLDLNAKGDVTEPVTVSGAGVGNNGAIINTGAGMGNGLKGVVTMSGPTTIATVARWDILSPGTLVGNGYKLTKLGGDQIYMPGIGETGLGDIDISVGQIILGGNTLVGNVGNTMTVFSGAMFGFYASTANPVTKNFVFQNNANCGQNNGASYMSGTVSLLSGTVNFSGDGTANTIFAPISGAGALAKSGLHTLILNGTNTYSANTTINAGRLSLGANASISNTPIITVASGALFDVTALGASGFPLLSNQVLQGTGIATGLVNVTSGGIVQPGTDGTVGTLSISNGIATGLYLRSGARMRFDLSSTATTPGGGVNDLVTIVGDLLQVSPTTIQFNFLGGAPVLGSAYTLIRYSGAGFVAAGNFVAATHYTATFDTSVAGEVRVTFSGAGTNLLWKGDGLANAWDNGLTTNWLNLGLPAWFFAGDSVLFDDTGSNNVPVTLVAPISPNSTVVSASKDYTLAGAGILTGSLTKQGAGTLMLNNASTYSGLTLVTGGTVKQGNAAALGNSPTVVVTNTGVVDINGITSSMGRAYVIGGSGPDGNGAIKNTFVTPVYGANSGVRNLFLTNNATVGTIGAGVTDAGRFDIGNGGGVDGGGFTLTKVGASGIAMQGGATNLAQLTINNGMVWAEGVNSNLGATVVVNSPGKVGANARTMGAPITLNGGMLAAINGASWWLGTLTLSGNCTVDTGVPYTGYAGSDIYVGGLITGSGMLIKTNANTLLLTNVNDYSGGTLIAGGNLQLGNSTPYGSVAGPITNNGLMIMLRTDNIATFTNPITGIGSIQMYGVNSNRFTSVNLTGTAGNGIWVGNNAGGAASLVIDAGDSITTPRLFAGQNTSRAGNFLQLGGVLNVTDNTDTEGPFRVGHWGTETSTYTMSGGQLFVTNGVNSRIALGIDGTGVWNMLGGTAMVSRIDVNGRNATGGGVLNLTNGLIQVGGGGIVVFSPYTINLAGGTLQSYQSFSSAASATLADTTGAFNLDTVSNATFTISGVLSGAGGFNKIGLGNLVLSGINTYAGNTVVSNGTLAGAGSVASPVTVVSGGTLSAGAMVSAGTFTVSNDTTLNSGGALFFDLANTTGIGGGTNDLIDVKSNLTLNGTVLVNFNFLNLAPALGVPYTIVKYLTRSGGAANLQYALAGFSHYTPTFDDSVTNEIRVTFTGNANMTWRGDGVNNYWDTGATMDWWNGTALDYFYASDTVTFDNTGSNNIPVALVGTLLPSGVLINAAKDYTLAGAGKISGVIPLSKQGNGLFTITTTNDYTGVTTIGGGAVGVPWLANGGLPSPIGAASSAAGNLVLTNGGVLQYTGASVTNDRAFTLGLGGGGLQVTDLAATLAVNSILVGANNFTKSGAGTLRFLANQTYTGPTIIAGGKVSIATSKLYSTFGWGNVTTTISNGAIWEVGGWADADTYNPAQVNFSAFNLVLDNGTIRYVATSAAANNFDRGFTIGAGGATLEAASSFTWGLIDMNRGYTIVGNGGLLTLTGSSNGNITMMIPGTGGLLKTGTGTWSLGPINAARNSYTGGTTVSNGVLALTVGGGTGCIRNNLTIAPGATLLSQAGDSLGYTAGVMVTNINVIGGSFIHGSGNNISIWGEPLNLTGGFAGATNLAGGRFDLGNGTVINTFATNISSVIGGVNVTLRQTGNLFTVAEGDAAVDLQVTAPVVELVAGSGITKVGAGLMRLDGTNTYTGTTFVNGGTLALGANGSIANSAQISVNSNGIFDVSLPGGFALGGAKSLVGNNGIIVGDFSVNSNATVSPAGYAAGGTLTFSNRLTLTNGSIINWNLANVTTVGANVNDLINVGGDLVLNGPVTFPIYQLNPTLAVGVPYRLFNYSGALVGNITNLVVGNSISGTRYTYTLDTNTVGQINLIVGSTAPSGLVWKGIPASQNWNLADSNWLNGVSFDRFFNADQVLFNDTASYFTVGLPATVQPGGITVDAVNTYTMSGVGKISGMTPITKLNTGLLVLGGTNDFTGPIVVDNGILRVGNTNALGAVTSPLYVTNNGTFDVNGFDNTDKPVFARGAGFTNGGAIVNTLNAGGTFNALRTVTLLGDTTFGGVNRWDIRNGPNPKLIGNGYTLTKVGAAYVAFVTTGETDLGDIYLNNGTLSFESTSTMGRPANTAYVNSGTILQFYAANVGAGYNKNLVMNGGTIYKLVGTATLLGPVALNGVSNIFQVANNTGADLTISNVISGSGALVKTDLGNLKLAGTNTYTGSTFVTAGNLVLLTNTSLASTNIVLAPNTILDVTAQTGYDLLAGQTLSGNGTVLGNLTNSGATIIPGSSVGTLTLSSNLVLAGGTLTFEIGSVTNEGGAFSDLLTVGRDLVVTNATTIHLTPWAGVIDTNNPYTLISYSGALVGDPGLLMVTSDSHYTFALDFNVAGKVRVVVTGGGPADLLWVGNYPEIQADWDVAFSPYWTGSQVFYQGDQVTFDDAAASFEVNLVGSLSPRSMLFRANGVNYTFVGAGALGGGAITKIQDGSYTFANSGLNYFAGPLDIQGGTIQFGNGGAFGNLPAAVVVTNNGTLAFNRSDTFTLANNIQGPGSLVQQGPGILVLNSVINAPIVVNGGTLRYGAANVWGGVGAGTTVTPGGTLDVNGLSVSNEPVTLAGAGVGGTGAVNNSGAIQMNALRLVTLAGDTTFGVAGNRYDIRSNADGPASLSSGGQPWNISKVGNGQLDFVEMNMDPAVSNITVAAGILEFASLGYGVTNFAGDPNGTLTLSNGATLALWNLSNVFNKPLVLNNGSTVNNNSGNATLLARVTLASNATLSAAGTVLVSNVVDGAGRLTKAGAGTLILGGDNTFTGSTLVNGGNLQIGNGSGTGSLVSSVTNPVNSTITFWNTNASAMPGNIIDTGGAVVQASGSGPLTFGGTNNLGNLYVQSGNFNNPLILAPGSSNFITGTLAVAPTPSGKIIIQPGAALRVGGNFMFGEQPGQVGQGVQLGGNVAVNGQFRLGHWANNTSTYLMGGGTFTMTATPGAAVNQPGVAEQGGVIYLGIDGTGVFTQTGGVVSAHGMVLNNRGDNTGPDTYEMQGGTLALGPSGFKSGSYDASQSYLIKLGGGTVSSWGSWTSMLRMTLTGTGGDVTFNPGVYTNILGGVLSGNGGFVKDGPGVLALTNANTYYGATTVSNGILAYVGSLAPGAGAVTVAGGTLIGTATLNAPVVVQSGGILAPGLPGLYDRATLTINHTLNLAGATVMDINKAGTVLTSDRILGVTTLTYGGTLTVLATGNTLAAGDRFTLFTAGSYTGGFGSVTLPSLDPNLFWDVTRLAIDGSIGVQMKPAVTGFGPDSQLVECGSNPSFTVTATGTALYYQWFRNLVLIPWATGPSITLTNVSAADAGSYTVVVTNGVGSSPDGPGVLTVQDTTVPTITCPADITVTNSGGLAGVIVSFTPTTSDNCSVTNTVCEPASGSTFPLGTNTVTCTVWDGAGLTNICAFTVTVRRQPGVSGQVALEGYVGPAHDGHGFRTVTFKATDNDTNVLATWEQLLEFTPDANGFGVASFTISNAPAATTHISAKTAWNLRTRLAVTFVDAQAAADFTGAGLLRGGDLTGTNGVDMDDYYQLAAAWYQVNDAADIDGSGKVDLDDYFLLSNRWGQLDDAP